MSSMPRYVDAHDTSFAEGQIRFVSETSRNGVTWWALDSRPCQTNMSHEPKLFGWCGETNNRSTYAHGLVRIVRVAENGRLGIEPLPRDEYAQALEALGYPELTPGE